MPRRLPRVPPVVLTLAGYDPSSGAGVTADIKTIAAHGCHGVSCICALTVQSTTGVRSVHAVPGDLVRETLAELAWDIPIAAARVGILGSREVAEVVADFLSGADIPHVVLDPILRSSSGAPLLDPDAVDFVRSRLLSLAEVITPNLDEAAALSGMPVPNGIDDMKRVALRLHQLGARNVVVTGGHLQRPADLLGRPARLAGRLRYRVFPSTRIVSNSTHGTGCAFAASLACRLALGDALDDAVAAAQRFVRNAIRYSYPMGRGVGPVNPLFALTAKKPSR